jgi:hypothetical protein
MSTQTPKPHWNPASEPPDDDVLVLLRLDSDEYPVWPGYHEAGRWVDAQGPYFDHQVLGWMHLEDAAKKLDL